MKSQLQPKEETAPTSTMVTMATTTAATNRPSLTFKTAGAKKRNGIFHQRSSIWILYTIFLGSLQRMDAFSPSQKQQNSGTQRFWKDDGSLPTNEGIILPNCANANDPTGVARSSTAMGLFDNVLTPQQILDPYLFPPNGPNTNIDAPQDVPKTLYAAIDLLQEAVAAVETAPMDLILGAQHQSQMPSVLRIEQQISHSVDPLNWLHAQQQLIQSHQPQSQSKTQPSTKLLYFANAESSIEVAAIGSCIEHQQLELHDFDQLPQNSRVYGGQRFDTTTQPDPEWQAFGNSGIWILPQIEMVRQSPCKDSRENQTTVLAVHLVRDSNTSTWQVEPALKSLRRISSRISPNTPPTTLPPIISQDVGDQEVYEQGVTEALDRFGQSDDGNTLEKVVLARRSKLSFDKSAEPFTALDVMRKWKFVNEVGHLFYLNPGNGQEFFGCTPEQLFRIRDGKVMTEALAGTRRRGSTEEEDAELRQELISSRKDRAENDITGNFIRQQLREATKQGLIRDDPSLSDSDDDSRYFVKKLLLLQHICQQFQCPLQDDAEVPDTANFLLDRMHPTPAVSGCPSEEAMEFIRQRESVAFDRGYYAGPFGFVSKKDAEIVVAIRSGLLSTESSSSAAPTRSLSVYAGAGIVPGSSVEGEWAETSHKLNVLSSLFPASPVDPSDAPTPNVAWASAFVEELIRCGVTQFYVCPGSRSTPLVLALSRALRSHPGIVHAQTIYDERGAAFRAVGYARGSGRPAAVITSSGTAVANLYPAVMEAGMDGVPVLILTADRPYESRDTGANQAVDQVKVFSSTYTRWFRDILPPTDDVPVSLALSDANHAVAMANEQRGPVHLNIQFRENLAPDQGQIRNDNRVDSITQFNGVRFTDVPNFYRWSKGGGRWSKQFPQQVDTAAASEVANLIRSSKRGIIVVGNIRSYSGDAQAEVDAIADFAEAIGFPIFAGVQSGSLRSRSSAVIPYAEHLLKNPLVGPNVKPDLVIQIGHPLISTEVPKVIREASRLCETDPHANALNHVFIHPHHPQERSDPDFTITHRVSAPVAPFMRTLQEQLKTLCDTKTECGSELTALIGLGRRIGKEMPSIVNTASQTVIDSLGTGETAANGVWMTEPQITLAVSEALSRSEKPNHLFLSNSMPVRDAEFFLYPQKRSDIGSIGVNRGASGIDGIISTAAGFADANDGHTSVLIGDLSALHDINALLPLSPERAALSSSASKRAADLTTIVVNNDGGGIFSFLPIAKHDGDVNFEEFFGTPTNTFSFEDGAKSFGVPFERAESADELVKAHGSALRDQSSSVIEATVVPRKVNVLVHQEITKSVNKLVSGLLEQGIANSQSQSGLSAKKFAIYSQTNGSGGASLEEEEKKKKKTMILLHGWMGDKSEWDDVGVQLAGLLASEWNIVAVDLAGHQSSTSSTVDDAVAALNLGEKKKGNSAEANGPTVDDLAEGVLSSLASTCGVKFIDAVAGYSLGGRVALAMVRLSSGETPSADLKLISEDTKIILLGSNPGRFTGPNGGVWSEGLDQGSKSDQERIEKDTALAAALRNLKCHSDVMGGSQNSRAVWSGFLSKWYGAGIWGGLRIRLPQLYRDMVARRAVSLNRSGGRMADVLEGCCPARSASIDWTFVNPAKVLLMTGELDDKYCEIGSSWKAASPELEHVLVPNAGHALLVEAPAQVASAISTFVHESRVVMAPLPRISDAPSGSIRPASLKYESFALLMNSGDRKEQGVSGVGWGLDAKADETKKLKQRKGFILQLQSQDGSIVGIGETSPLGGLHPESLEEAEAQLKIISGFFSVGSGEMPPIDAESMLKMQGELSNYLDLMARELGLPSFVPSVKSGLEMCLLSFAAQSLGKPLLESLASGSSPGGDGPAPVLPLNGLVTRGLASSASASVEEVGSRISFSSTKVKVGYQSAEKDVSSLLNALQPSNERAMLRADANRAWGESEAIEFANAVRRSGTDLADRIEFVEEPIQKAEDWSLKKQVAILERWYQQTGIKYALDESVADFLDDFEGDLGELREELSSILSGVHGCAALILKPAFLGLETSFVLAKLAHEELGVGAVFSSSFDSGIGLTYASFLASVSDACAPASSSTLFAHGLGTFGLLDGDVLSPPFGSHVNGQGQADTASLSRALSGLGLKDRSLADCRHD